MLRIRKTFEISRFNNDGECSVRFDSNEELQFVNLFLVFVFGSNLFNSLVYLFNPLRQIVILKQVDFQRFSI